ncbi:MAG TPA: pyridoxamine 5'-phosphate oxidase family protein [Bryobacteraceae bacterium]|nr:pyridoxamine 5'-phosphate oxidase family protein [Bryobacteraceae bacterium]
MPAAQGSVALLNDPVAKELLTSKIPARLAYVWTDGTPRVVPVWFHWNGSEFVIGTPPKAPKLKALRKNPKVALTIDDNTFPHKVLMIRGTAALEEVNGVVPEYELVAHRYFGEEQGKAWVQQVGKMLPGMVRVRVRPEWVGIPDFQARFPSALSS